jgi:hypothetical protein
VKIAVIERFAEPSRRCQPGFLTGASDEVVMWDLIREATERTPTPGEVARALPAWAFLRISPSRVWKYLRACREMRGLRRTALIRVPAWIRQARAHEIDAVACFSTDGFPLAELLAQETRTPCQELLAIGTQYFGEFAFELLAVIPYAYWLFEQGRLEFTISTADTRALYYFSPHHIEQTTKRRYVPITEYPVAEKGASQFDRLALPEVLDTTMWSPPPYRHIYANDRFQWTKPLVVITNKTSDERYLDRGFAVNSIPTDVLLDIIGRLSKQYTIVYNRPRESDIVGDHSELRELGDIEAVKRAFPNVTTIQELHAQCPDLSFNELQLRLFANCERFVSVLGGGSYLASYFGGTNIVSAQQGWEIDSNAYEGWFHRFSGARVIAARTSVELVNAVDREFGRPL